MHMQWYAAFETLQHVILSTQKNENKKPSQGASPSPTWFKNM
jgi:hypothetical protein